MRILKKRSPSLTATTLLALAEHPFASALIATAGVMAATAIVNRRLADKAQRDNPPQGRFIDIDGVRLHYVERGTGRPLVLFHGNGSMIQDFESSGLIDLAARDYRVIVFDRPGFGHSLRPRNVVWTPAAQADLFKDALAHLGVEKAIVLGHSWGASVAVSLASRHPAMVEALVLASGYYFPTARTDAMMAMAGPAIPGFGDILSHTISPILSRLMWPAMLRQLFGPKSVPQKFDGFPKALAVRPSQLRAGAAEAALMVPAAMLSAKAYGELAMPVTILAGEDDRLIDIDEQSGRLHDEIKHSKMHRVPNAGHMIQQSDTADLMAAVDEAAAQTLH
ncbi:alpha/beta hydrolase [Bradyrhizobium sp. WYCCWR 13023]|uniref:Alpha/beta hydrolase n=1 Tax=Bradyrhizobium zhengyangense TaxID=2911009 RepID=A0A9X1U997_9BRAD|nr:MULTISPECIES: alpha/beta hydrolase [Bradyrhizobium]MCG2626773.1 alpha/beta hydrolase [Bradyrhizobium zhengyangense]MCG2638140.1 alpha/beta hydrolase [Bradyrhizobium zhengyangense]MCG2666539.1 alpha/beta hydrolase [Bradyrhizobium zhengyangense]MDA9520672.1 alpha/beta hydrolase [Bradyrhizobium sp. CCBAU 11434]